MSLHHLLPRFLACAMLAAVATAHAGFITPKADPGEAPPPSPYFTGADWRQCAQGLSGATMAVCYATQDGRFDSLATAQLAFDTAYNYSGAQMLAVLDTAWAHFTGEDGERYGTSHGGLISAAYGASDQIVTIELLQALDAPFVINVGNVWGGFHYYFDGSTALPAGTVITFDATGLYDWGPNTVLPLTRVSLYTAATVPEPATLGLIAVALAAVCVRRRRRRR